MLPTNGPAFLLVYVLLILAGVLARWLVRRHLGRHSLAPEGVGSTLSAAEVGYLVEGSRRAHAAHLVAAREGAPEANSIHAVDPRARLAELGLILNGDQRSALKLWGGAIFGGLLAAGLARLWMGIARDKPTGFLVMLLVVVVGLLIWALRERMARTGAGDRVVAAMVSRYKSGLGDTSYAMGFALLGWTALVDNVGMQIHLRSHGTASSQSSGDGCSGGGHTGSSAGSSAGDGGGGGCGGCGGS